MAVVLSSCAVDPQTTLAPQSDFAVKIQDLLKLTFFLACGVFVVVEGMLAYVLIRYRSRGTGELPRQTHGNTRLEIAWTIAPAILLAIVAVPTVQTNFDTQAPPPAHSMQVNVIGHQWWWEFQYPALGITTANEVHLPLNKPVSFNLESADVMHSFWLPRLGGKRDVIPNHTNHLWWTPDAIGVSPGQCAQFCGTEHAKMGMKVFVQSQTDFNAWVKDQQAKPVPTTAATAAGAKAFALDGCIGCHTINGVSTGHVGPNLTHVASRTTIAANSLPNDPQHLAAWLRNPQAEKPGVLMPNLHLSQQDIQSLVVYLQSLK
ncbi:MAG: cytochrome c oxidase subunit II [Chloroflexota bacterium]